MIQLQVLPRIAVEGRTFDNETLIISIGAPNASDQFCAKIKGEHIYKFCFEDITQEYFLEANDYRDTMTVTPMSYEIAESIAEIAWDHRDKKNWIIHCEAGISRSPGVALGLSEFIDTDPDTEVLEKLFPCYNKHVRKLVVQAMEVKWRELRDNLRWNRFIGKDQ